MGKEHNQDDDPAENPVGRPDIGNSYGTSKHYAGQDPLGNKDLSKTFRDPNPLETLENKPATDSDKGTILDENNLMDM